LTATTTTRDLARMAGVTRDEIFRLVKRGVLHPAGVQGNGMLFDDAYAKRIAPLIGARNRMALSLACDRNHCLKRRPSIE
jgi:hypothetical protein